MADQAKSPLKTTDMPAGVRLAEFCADDRKVWEQQLTTLLTKKIPVDAHDSTLEMFARILSKNNQAELDRIKQQLNEAGVKPAAQGTALNNKIAIIGKKAYDLCIIP